MNEIIFSKKNVILMGIVVLFIGLYVIFALFLNDNSSVSDSGSYLYVGDYLVWEYENGNFFQLTKVSEDVQKHDYIIYDGLTKKEAKMAQYNNNTWYFFGDDYSDISINDFRIAYTGLKDDITLVDYSLEMYDSSDNDYIAQVNNTKNEEELSAFRASLIKTKVDLDNDGKEEVLYTMSSHSSEKPMTDYDMMSYLFVVDDGKVSVINKSEGLNPFTIIEILDLDDDGINDFIVSKGRANLPSMDECYQIYEFSDGKYQLKQDCMQK